MYHNNFMDITDILNRFVIYGCLGLFLEIIWTGLMSAVKGDKNLRCGTYLWMFFIYGAGVILEPLHELIREFLWIYRGFIWSAVIFAVEYMTGFILKLTIGSCPWNYDGDGDEIITSVKGIIRIDYLPVWFFVGLLFERVHDFIKVL